MYVWLGPRKLVITSRWTVEDREENIRMKEEREGRLTSVPEYVVKVQDYEKQVQVREADRISEKRKADFFLGWPHLNRPCGPYSFTCNNNLKWLLLFMIIEIYNRHDYRNIEKVLSL